MRFGAISEDEKCFKLLFILNIHILRSEDGCFTVTLAPKLKMELFYQSKLTPPFLAYLPPIHNSE